MITIEEETGMDERMSIIDAGSKTFSGDIIPESVGLAGYGVTTDGSNGVVVRMNEEHGIVRLAPGFAPEVGDKMAFFPNHVCTAVNLSDELLVVREGIVQHIWPVAARGRNVLEIMSGIRGVSRKAPLLMHELKQRYNGHKCYN